MFVRGEIFMKAILSLRSNRGQGLVEYIFVVGLVALLVYVAVMVFGQNVQTAFNKAANQVTNATKW